MKISSLKTSNNSQNKINNIDGVIAKILDNPYKYAKSASSTELIDVLRRLSHVYYNTDEELVPDEIYDLLRETLEEKDPNNPFLKEIGAPINKNVEIKLPYPMPSLEKIKPDTDALYKFIKKYTGPYVLSDKLDGMSALYINNGKASKLFTRGDGSVGQDISYLMPYIISKIDIRLIPKKVAIRGELIISKNNFKKINKKYKNARGAAAGLINAKHYSVDVAKLTDFVGYAILNPKYEQSMQMKTLEKWKFPTVDYHIKKQLDNEYLSDHLITRRNEGKYEIDGIVVIDSSKIYNLANKNPSHGFAFKKVLTDQIAEVIVLDVEWNISKDGYIKPKVRIKTVKIGGVEITYATAFNAQFVVNNKLGPGAVIELIRSGDVIPHINKIIKSSSNGKPKMPDIPYKWNETMVDILVQDIHGVASSNIKIKQIGHFFKTLQVKYISEGIITKLVLNGYDNIIKIVNAKVEDLSKINGLGKTIVDKIHTNIHKGFNETTLERLMAASNVFGRGFGVRRLKVILNAYPDILLKKWDSKTVKQKIIALNGFDDKTASQFAQNLHKFKQFFDKLKTVTDLDLDHIKVAKITVSNSNIFEDGNIVFTGFRDKKLEEFVEKNGGKISSTVSNNTTLVVYVEPKDKPESSKLKKAKSLKIKLMTRDEFKSIYINK
jgi:NAD-dependent DNA ligase